MASVRPEVERTALAPHDGKSGEPAADADGAGTLGAGDAALIQDRRASFKHHLYQQLLVVISARRSERLGEHELRLELARLAEEIAGKTDTLGLAEQQTLVEQVLDEAVGYGPLEGVLRDHEISDILINGPWQVFVEKRGQLRATDVTFRDDAHLLEVLGRMITGRWCRSAASVCARLPPPTSWRAKR